MVFADLQGNFEAFFSRAAEFFRHLSEIEWTTFGVALLCLLGMQLARAWAWRLRRRRKRLLRSAV